MASLQPINPAGDPRIEHRSSRLNGHTYHYLYGEPASGRFKNTIFLVSICTARSFGIWPMEDPVDKNTALLRWE